MKQKSSLFTTVLFVATACVTLLVSSSPSHADDLSDDFDEKSSLQQWTVLKSSSNENLHQDLSLGSSREGWLTIRPRANHAWYNDGMGPMLYKMVEGDFMVETNVVTHRPGSRNQAPNAHYNSAGLIVRDPASSYGQQNWVVVNVGRQDPFTGSEIKTTVNSRSHLELQPGNHSGKVRLARIGSTIYGLRKLNGESEWTLIRTFDRNDLPSRVQVGLMCNGWTGNADLVAEYDYVRFSVPESADDLTKD